MENIINKVKVSLSQQDPQTIIININWDNQEKLTLQIPRANSGLGAVQCFNIK